MSDKDKRSQVSYELTSILGEYGERIADQFKQSDLGQQGRLDMIRLEIDSTLFLYQLRLTPIGILFRSTSGRILPQ